MRKLAELISFFAAGLILGGTEAAHAQTSNRVWFAVYNGLPSPSSDVAIQTLLTDGSASLQATGTASSFVAQTNFTAFSSPYDVAVDPAMGKVYVLDNNVQGATPEYIYSFNLSGTPAKIATSGRIIFTMPVPAVDSNAMVYPLISGLALDAANHYLYFLQVDRTTATNSYLGRLDLATSSASDLYASNGINPVLHEFYPGQIPGQGPISVDATNVYLGAINSSAGNSGVYVAPRDGGGVFSEIVALTTNDLTFSNGFVSGVLSDPADHYVYYLTWNAGALNGVFNLAQNAVRVYNTLTRSNAPVASGYQGYPDNIAADFGNGRYYFTLGRDGTGNPNQTNYQAIYTGSLGSISPPTRLYSPALSGQDMAGGINAGDVALQGVFIEDPPTLASLAGAIYLASGDPVILSPGLVTGDTSSTLLAGATVAISSGTFVGDGDVLTALTTNTTITATYNSSTETLTLSGNDTLANYQQVLRTVAFSSTNSDPTGGQMFPSRTFTWTLSDAGASSVPVVSRLTLSTAPAPAARQLKIAGVAGGWILLYTGVSNQAYVFQTAAAVSGPWSDLSPILTANAGGFVAFEDQAMPLVRTRFYRVYHPPPTLSSLSASIYLVGGAPVILCPGLETGDPSSARLAGAAVTISGGIFAGDGDFLTVITNGTAIAEVYNSLTETLTLSGSDTLADYQQVLQSVAFGSTNSNPTDNLIFPTRTVTWSVADAAASSATVSNSITLLTVGAPAIGHVKIVGVKSGWILLFTGTASQAYVIQTAATLNGPWSDLSSVLTANAAGLVTYEDAIMPLAQTRYYRVRSAL